MSFLLKVKTENSKIIVNSNLRSQEDFLVTFLYHYYNFTSSKSLISFLSMPFLERIPPRQALEKIAETLFPYQVVKCLHY